VSSFLALLRAEQFVAFLFTTRVALAALAGLGPKAPPMVVELHLEEEVGDWEIGNTTVGPGADGCDLDGVDVA
jgi:hypothetical protein